MYAADRLRLVVFLFGNPYFLNFDLQQATNSEGLSIFARVRERMVIGAAMRWYSCQTA